MTYLEIKIHTIILNIIMSLLIWILICKFIIPIKLYQYILIELVHGIGLFFLRYIKSKLNINNNMT
jgi:hypothetical protein